MERRESAAQSTSDDAHGVDDRSAGTCDRASEARTDGAPCEGPGCLAIEVTANGGEAGLARRPVTAEETAQILKLHHAERWPVGTIGAQLGRHHDTIERVLAQAGLGVHKQSTRARLVDPYVPFVKETLEKYPRLRASRLWSMAKARGCQFAASWGHLRRAAAEIAPS